MTNVIIFINLVCSPRSADIKHKPQQISSAAATKYDQFSPNISKNFWIIPWVVRSRKYSNIITRRNHLPFQRPIFIKDNYKSNSIFSVSPLIVLYIADKHNDNVGFRIGIQIIICRLLRRALWRKWKLSWLKVMVR